MEKLTSEILRRIPERTLALQYSHRSKMPQKPVNAVSSKPRGRVAKRARTRKAAFLVLAFGFILIAAFAGWRGYGEFQRRQLVQRSRALIERKDYQQAAISTQRVLQLRPNDIEGIRLMIDVSTAVNPASALEWHKQLVRLQPEVSANQLALAECALRLRELNAAARALETVSAEGKQTAEFHNLAGRLAQITKQSEDAEAHLLQAVELEPMNEKYRFDLAIAQVFSPDDEIRAKARAMLEAVKPESRYYASALRALVQDAITSNRWNMALSVAITLQDSPGAAFDDRVLCLSILKQMQHEHFASYFLELQEKSAAFPHQIATLIEWMNVNQLSMVAIDWTKRLSPEVWSQPPVSPALAQAYANLRDWKGLKGLLIGESDDDPDWHAFEYSRLSALALVFREQGDRVNSEDCWKRALKAAGNRPEILKRLAEFAERTGWKEEAATIRISLGHPGGSDQR
jgi:tetratricopeptide (TPR) repeat protein